jgi:hypothetical protein
MNKQRVNSMVLAYQNGDETAFREIFDAINPMIERASREVEPFIEDFTKFDCRVVREIERLIKSFQYGSHDFMSSVKAVIERNKAQYIRRDSRKSSARVSMSKLEDGNKESESDDNLGYQFKSTANTEDDVLFKERVTLLAQGDPRRKVILEQWSRGAEDLAISELLAQLFGGKSTGHRSFIKRFKTECRDRLASEMA